MEKEINYGTVLEDLGKVGNFDKLRILKPGLHDLSIVNLDKDKNTLISKIKNLIELKKQLLLIYEEKETDIKNIKSLMNPIYTNQDRTKGLKLKEMHKKIKGLRKEKQSISRYQRHVKELENTIRSGLGVIDYIKRNRECVTSFKINIIYNSRFSVTLYTGENKN